MQTISAYPLQWPVGWPRATSRKTAKFSRKETEYYSRADGTRSSRTRSKDLTIAQASERVRAELRRLGCGDDFVISANLELRLDGQPKSGQREPADPGVAVYWRTRKGENRCMAIDLYDCAADNLAAVAATLDAMRAIDRHGGAQVMERAFTGFTALPAPAGSAWWEVLSVPRTASQHVVRDAYRTLRSCYHPDRPGGDADKFHAIQKAYDAYCALHG